MFLEYDIIPVLLTKGAIPNEDWVLFTQFKEFHFGITLTHGSHYKTNEEGALDSIIRMAQLERAHALGLKTWISLEPVIYPEEVYEIIRDTFQFCDLYKVGKWNYDQRAKEIDWKDFVTKVKLMFKVLNCNYYIKESLKPFDV